MIPFCLPVITVYFLENLVDVGLLIEGGEFGDGRTARTSCRRGCCSLVFSLFVPILGCTGGASVKNTSELIQALAKQGIAIENQEMFSIPLRAGHIDESIALTGQNLRIEVLRVEDEE